MSSSSSSSPRRDKIDIFRNRIGLDHGGHFASRAFVVIVGGSGLFGGSLDDLLAAAAWLGRLLGRRLGFYGNGLCRNRICFGWRRYRLVLRDDADVGLFLFGKIECGFDVFDIVIPAILGFRSEQRLAIRKRDLVVVGMDFGEGEKAVPPPCKR